MKTSKLLTFFFVSSIFIFSFTSCEKTENLEADIQDQPVETSSKTSDSRSAITTSAVMVLDKTEFDIIGTLHNQGLEYIHQKYLSYNTQNPNDPLTEDEQIQFIIDKTADFLSNKSFTINGVVVNSFPSKTVTELQQFILDSENTDMYEFTNLETATSIDPEDIEDIENLYIYDNQSINYQMLSCGAVYSSSLIYWQSKNGGYKTSDINWYSIAWADANAAASGAQWGFVMGGPVTAVGGGLSMGILGSAVAGFVGSLW